MTKYDVYVHKTVTEYWTVEAESERDAELYYEFKGMQTGLKEHEKEITVYEDDREVPE